MANEGDLGSAQADFDLYVAFRNHKAKAAKEVRLQPNGYCHAELCGEKLRSKTQLFCNSACAEAYDKHK